MKKIFSFCAVLATFWFAPCYVQAQSITISEINYKSDITLDAGDWLELHNYGATPIDLSGWVVADTGTVSNTPFIIPAGTMLPAGGYLVVCRTISKFISRFPAVTNRIGGLVDKFNSTDQINLSNASGVLVLSVAYDNSGAWPNGADGEGRTLQLRNESTNTALSNAASWRSACMEGSPGSAPLNDCNDPIIFSEINYNSDSIKDVSEFIELYNRSSSPINLAGYYLRDRWDSVLNTYTFPVGTVLPPGGYVVVSNDSVTFKKYYIPQTGKFFANFDFNLSNGGELIRLYKPNNELLYTMHYNDSLPWTDSADGLGYTLEFKNYALNCNEGINWFAGCIGGSPFTAYNPVCVPLYPLGISSTSTQDPLVTISPNPSTGIFTILDTNATGGFVRITDVVGRVVYQGELAANAQVDIHSVPDGLYSVTVTHNQLRVTKTILKQ
jgi:hypothetical protein